MDPSALAERLVDILDRLRRLALEGNPLEDAGVTMPQLSLLDWIAAAPGSGVQEAADGLGLSAPTVSVTLRRLEDAGLVARAPDPDDRRAVRLSLTEAGLALHRRARAFRRRRMGALLAALHPEEQRTLVDLLARAVEGAGSVPPAPDA